MSEEIPKKSQEFDNAHHDQIIFLLYALDFVHGKGDKDDKDSKDLLCNFQETKYRELSSMFGYESITIHANKEGVIFLHLTYVPFDDRQQTDTYKYDTQDRSLVLVSVASNQTGFLEDLNGRQDYLEEQLAVLNEASEKAYASMVDGLRSIDKYSSIFEAYDKENDTISVRRNALCGIEELDKGLQHELAVQRLENEAGLVALFDMVASVDKSFARLLGVYREALSQAKAIDVQIDLLGEQIRQEENESKKVNHAADPHDFIRLLDIASKLEEDAA